MNYIETLQVVAIKKNHKKKAFGPADILLRNSGSTKIVWSCEIR